MDTPIAIECRFDSNAKLYSAYMPYVQGGGVFYRTAEKFEMGAPVMLKLQLPEEIETHEITGEVVWITPKGAQSNRPAGVGIQFKSDNSKLIVNKIETHLAGLLKSSQLTDTM